MRAWPLLVKDQYLVGDISLGNRKYICFVKSASTAKRVHVGDTVMIHNCFGPHRVVVKKVVEKRMIRRPGQEANPEQVPCIYLRFE